MPISSECLLKSISRTSGKVLTTFRIKVPLAVWIDILTHRALSRNASSSRAIPTATWRKKALADPAIPIKLTKFQKGMSANEPVEDDVDKEVRSKWREALEYCARIHTWFEYMNLSKQDANIILYQFSHVEAILSATDWKNFFLLRKSDKAKPDLHLLAQQMKLQMETKDAQLLGPGEWHTPLVDEEEEPDVERRKKISVGRCAAVSYFLKEKWDAEKDILRCEKLLADLHLSPFEHVATPFALPGYAAGNFRGFLQYRKLIEPNIEEDCEDTFLSLTEIQMLGEQLYSKDALYF